MVYVCRVKAAMAAFGYDPDKLTVLLLQMVALFRDGQLVKLSKRSGDSVTLDELIEEVGVDASRYFFLMVLLDSQLDFSILTWQNLVAMTTQCIISNMLMPVFTVFTTKCVKLASHLAIIVKLISQRLQVKWN